MTDFREAFHSGLNAYEKAESARTEIFQVFDELAKQVREASNGLIRIERKDQLGLQQMATRMIEGVTSALSSLPSNRPPPTYEALIATISNQRQGAKLCEYELSQQGYPVTLVYDKIRDRCHDRESLEVALQSLLKHPSTGGKLRALLSLATEANDAGATQRPPEPDDDDDE